MGYCDIKNPPVFTTEVDKWDKSTRDNGEEMAVPLEAIFNNTVYNKAEIEQLKGKTLTDVTLLTSEWNSLTYEIPDSAITEVSDVELYFGFDSIPAAQKANIRGRCEVGKLVLVAAKLPTVDLAIKKIRIVNLEQRGD